MPKSTHRARIAWLACVIAFAGTAPAMAQSLATGVKNYKPFAVEHIGIALAGAKDLQAALKAGDVKAAQAAWIKSRKGWEVAEPITGQFFGDLDRAIDSWPDAKQGYHAVEAPLFAGKLDEIKAPVDGLVANLERFQAQVSAPSFQFTPQGLLDGATGLAYEMGENKSKGGESPYAGTSVNDIYENNEGVEAVYKLVFSPVLRKKDAKLDKQIRDKIEEVEDNVKGKDLTSINAAALRKSSEELAVLLQSSAPKLGLEKPKLGED
ncbi:MAG: hypothetical protein OJF62_001574 [Pseudolabrys sp.]|jgi:iron uptake system component EfeO|nr:hypothetical protein [Pseudolabrys sp.]